jgi:hypothetical protein
MSDMTCPRCKGGAGVVALEDGVWMCTDCTIEFNEDGRACGGFVRVGELRYLDGVSPEPMFTAGVSVSAPRKDATVLCVIRLDSVGDIEELARKLYESLKRASE